MTRWLTLLIVASLCSSALSNGKGKGKEKEKPAAKDVASCRMKGKSVEDCRTELNVTAPADAKGKAKADVEDKARAQKGLKTALGDSISNCSDSKDECTKKAKQAMANLTGKTPTEAEFKAEIQKAGAKKASDKIKDCIKNLGSKPDKDKMKECVLSDAAKDAMAAISGENKSKISDRDLMKSFKKNMITTVAEELKTCLDSADNSTAKKACYKKDDLKALIAGAEGKAVDKIKTSDMRAYFKKNAQDDAWAMLKSCNKSAMDACKEAAKQELAAALGKNGSEVTDEMLEMESSKAMINELNDKMSTCLQDAGSDKAKKKKCRTSLVKESLKNSRVGGSKKEPTKADVAVALKRAAKQKAQEVSESCTKTRAECMKLLKTQMESLGQNVSDVELERLNTEGAKEAAKSAAKACAEAKKEDKDATCEDPFEKFLSYQKKAKSGNAKKAKAEERKLKEELSKSLKKDAMRVCFESANKTEADACLAGLANESNDVSEDLFKDLPSKVKEAKKKRAQRDAKLELVGERFHECMKEAENQTESDACMDDMKSKMNIAGIGEDSKMIAMRFRGKMIRDAAKNCESKDRKACLEQMKEELKKTGVKPRAFATIKRIGAVKASAETWVACKEGSNNSEADCDGLANETLREQSGAQGDVWDEMKDKVKTLAGNLMNGTETELKSLPRIAVEVETSGTECNANASAALVQKVANTTEVKAANVTAAEVRSTGCAVIFEKATYRAEVPTKKLNASGIANLSDSIAIELSNIQLVAGRRLLITDARRLAAISNTYADQAVEECAVGDASCGQAPTPTPTPSQGPGPSPTPSPDGTAPSPTPNGGAPSPTPNDGTNLISGCSPIHYREMMLYLSVLISGFFVL
eukprot:TRINITY_DN2461_c0_g2_i2.p1 TRINITY_DN2461_c0_g2~~TRINITY_DN2461_c0_g2_i2.p1  ORF type:complete len:872 (+),score=247.35 TRINITY_DN2461_c0_g2_i2:74-2689(+)